MNKRGLVTQETEALKMKKVCKMCKICQAAWLCIYDRKTGSLKRKKYIFKVLREHGRLLQALTFSCLCFPELLKRVGFCTLF